jgi:hypothetical protein
MNCYKISYNTVDDTIENPNYIVMYIVSSNINIALDVYKETSNTILAYTESKDKYLKCNYGEASDYIEKYTKHGIKEAIDEFIKSNPSVPHKIVRCLYVNNESTIVTIYQTDDKLFKSLELDDEDSDEYLSQYYTLQYI